MGGDPDGPSPPPLRSEFPAAARARRASPPFPLAAITGGFSSPRRGYPLGRHEPGVTLMTTAQQDALADGRGDGEGRRGGAPGIRSLIPARLDRLGWSRFHTMLVVALGVAWVLDGLEITIASNVTSLISGKQVSYSALRS